MTNNGKSLPPVPAPFRLPFHYGAFHNIGIDFLVDPKNPTERLRGTSLEPTLFGGKACVSLNYQMYFAQFENGGSVIQEIEVNIIAHPTANSSHVPTLTYEQFAQGEDQTKLIGNSRIHVVCDSALAIEAGKKLFGEPKIPAVFDVTMPTPNAKPAQLWKIACNNAILSSDKQRVEPKSPKEPLFSFEADLSTLAPAPVSIAPFTEYGVKDKKPVAAPLNVSQPYQGYTLTDATSGRVKLTVSAKDSDVGKTLTELIGTAKAAGIWVYQSPVVAQQNRAYYVETKS
ncbi:hypothetical protein GCM10010193_04140 [Kitasatospora atroaurantiaca]|uniref:Acetoacetate decarboxylase n=1 Tax=Kitasatospora atroaurantiaca TaxID=285545 RepID=A0A561EM32_9ACTN|nr:hypothetical protein [Kitasatospora atroaurantiaca]TWE16632.1 hypothetical protein FB465_1615 [Kitasatospora atroaurantiaca]